jgi:hypothetical protein
MRLALMPLLILPLFAAAAEPLEGKSLEETYISASPECRPAEKDRKSGNCPPDVINRAVVEAEEQSAGRDPATQSITTPPPPPARQPPPDELSPYQRQLMDQIKSLPGQIQR